MICLSHQNWCGFFSLVTNMNSFRRTIIIQQCRDNCVAFFVAMKQRKEKRMNNTFMKKKPILPLLASMAMPMVLSMLVNSLYNIVDSFFVAKISEQAMTALSLVFPVQNFINAVAIGFGVGINAQISFQLGAKNIKNANIAATHGMLFNIIHGIIFTVICIPFMPVFLSMFTKEQEVISSGVQYSTEPHSSRLHTTLLKSLFRIFYPKWLRQSLFFSFSNLFIPLYFYIRNPSFSVYIIFH